MRYGLAAFHIKVAHVILYLEVLSNLFYVVYYAVDPAMLRGIIPLQASIPIICCAMLCGNITTVTFQFYWLDITRRFRNEGKVFMHDETVKKCYFVVIALFTVAIIYFAVYCIIPPVLPHYMATLGSTLIVVHGFLLLSLVIGMVINKVRITTLLRQSKSVSTSRATKITTLMVIGTIGVGIFMLTMISILFTTDVWRFFASILIAQLSAATMNLTKVLSFATFPEDPNEPPKSPNMGSSTTLTRGSV